MLSCRSQTLTLPFVDPEASTPTPIDPRPFTPPPIDPPRLLLILDLLSPPSPDVSPSSAYCHVLLQQNSEKV
ncbi:hypothetical protein L484_022308 [Morus notabilis]|uniref:Uncharacterized protein n=1 Tax=Morus notabilis TaxID=981085 RepID=W9QJ37_9ROSA|nr:hypothetical protein L484_022308 [Morus notabilis]